MTEPSPLQHIFASPAESKWQLLRGQLEDLRQLLPFLDDPLWSDGSGNHEHMLQAADAADWLCIVRVDEQCESPFCHHGPVVTIAFTQAPVKIDDPCALQLNRGSRGIAPWNRDQLFGLLSAARQAAYLSVANRILSSFQFEERSELEFEPWFRGFANALTSVVRADFIRMQLRTPSDFWVSRGDRWNWPEQDSGSMPELDAQRMNDICRAGVIEYDSAANTECSDSIRSACVPLRSRGLSLGVLTLHYLQPVAVLPDERRLLELLQREVALLMDRTRNHLRMQRLATIDGLTNLYNHRFFRIQLRTEFQRALRYQKKMSLIMIDIDDFKNYNDRYGHLAGDRVLTEVGRTIRATVRDIDFVARYGGEEFALILPEVDSSGGMVVAEKVRTAVGAQRFKTESGEDMGSITVSCGVTDNVNTTGPNDLIRRADRALYWVKTHGRNLVRLADPVEES